MHPLRLAELHSEFVRALTANGITDHVDGVTELEDSEWWMRSSPLDYENESYESWWRKKNQKMTGGTKPLKPGKVAYGRPFSVEEVAFYCKIIENIRQSRSQLRNTSDLTRLRLLLITRGRRGILHPAAFVQAAKEVGFEVVQDDFRGASTLDEWHQHLEFLRSFHVIFSPHGAGLTNVLWMLPNRAVLVELYPECWCYSFSTRFMYSRGLASHAQVRTINLGVPCRASQRHFLESCWVNQAPPVTPHTIQQGLYVETETPQNISHVKKMATELFLYLHDRYLTIPLYTAKTINLPIIDMDF